MNPVTFLYVILGCLGFCHISFGLDFEDTGDFQETAGIYRFQGNHLEEGVPVEFYRRGRLVWKKQLGYYPSRIRLNDTYGVLVLLPSFSTPKSHPIEIFSNKGKSIFKSDFSELTSKNSIEKICKLYLDSRGTCPSKTFFLINPLDQLFVIIVPGAKVLIDLKEGIVTKRLRSLSDKDIISIEKDLIVNSISNRHSNRTVDKKLAKFLNELLKKRREYYDIETLAKISIFSAKNLAREGDFEGAKAILQNNVKSGILTFQSQYQLSRLYASNNLFEDAHSSLLKLFSLIDRLGGCQYLRSYSGSIDHGAAFQKYVKIEKYQKSRENAGERVKKRHCLN